MECIELSRQGQAASMGCVGWPHLENYEVHQFQDAIQSGHNVTVLGALGTPHLAIFRAVDPSLPKGETTYNQWAFKVHSLQSHYQEEVLCEGIIQSLKGDATDMIRYLGPTPSVNAILDKLNSLYGSMSTFDVTMQGFYRECQGRSESVAHYVARLKGKLNKIHVKHLNRAPEADTAGYIRDHLFYSLRNPLWEVICAKCDNPMNDYMVLMWAARKAKGEHIQEKHNHSCASKPGIVNEVPLGNEGNTNPDPKAPSWEPWAKKGWDATTIWFLNGSHQRGSKYPAKTPMTGIKSVSEK